MDYRKQRLSCETAKEIDLVEYLSLLGHEPQKIIRNDYWYLSPLRNERTASFKINRSLNRWYDFGEGKGGSIIDFGILYFSCTVADFLRKLDVNDIADKPFITHDINKTQKEEPKIEVVRETDLHSFYLVRYLAQRKINLRIAEQYCREITYEMNNSIHIAIGFKNNAGGYELRSPGFKGSSSPKDITTIRTGHRYVNVYEGFFDFLSHRGFFCTKEELPHSKRDHIILNSLSLFDRILPLTGTYKRVALFLDNDTAGQNCIDKALKISPRFVDARKFYRQFKDLNDWLKYIRQDIRPPSG